MLFNFIRSKSNTNNYWDIKKIFNKNKFLAYLIQQVPEGSIWKADSINDKRIYLFLEKYLTKDARKEYEKIKGSEKDFFEIELSEKNKPLIEKAVRNWNLDDNIHSQSIVYNTDKYLESYDYLDESCTWVSKKIDLVSLERDKILELEI